ncbi:putative aminopeptidase npepl1, partial [Perkinsus olseni]
MPRSLILTQVAGKVPEKIPWLMDPSTDHSQATAKIDNVLFGSRGGINFHGDISLGAERIGTLSLVGQLAALKGFLPVAPREVQPHLERFIKAQDDAKDSAPNFTVALECLDGEGELTKLVVLKVPEESSRFNTRARPDQVTKLLAEQGDLCSSRAARVIAVAESEEDVIASGLAVARAAPLYREKGKGEGRGAVSATLWSMAAGGVAPRLSEKLGRVAENIRTAAALVDMPPNYINPVTYTGLCEKIADELRRSGHDVRLEVIRAEELRDGGFGGIWNVGKGSVGSPPALVRLSWYPEGTQEGEPGTVLVGKGITFDTGGLSIKSSDNMRGMKTDIGGAAGLLGAFMSAVQCGGNKGKPLHLVECLAENAVGPFSYRVDDVIKMYSGLTVEINNTDAEGRLLLADGVAYAAKHLNPE